MYYYNENSPDSLAPTTRTFKLLESCHRHFLIKFLLLLFLISSIFSCAPTASWAAFPCASLYSKFSLRVGRPSVFCSGSCGAILFDFNFFDVLSLGWSTGLQRFVFGSRAATRYKPTTRDKRKRFCTLKVKRERPSTKHLSLLKGVQEMKKKALFF